MAAVISLAPRIALWTVPLPLPTLLAWHLLGAPVCLMVETENQLLCLQEEAVGSGKGGRAGGGPAGLTGLGLALLVCL